MVNVGTVLVNDRTGIEYRVTAIGESRILYRRDDREDLRMEYASSILGLVLESGWRIKDATV